MHPEEHDGPTRDTNLHEVAVQQQTVTGDFVRERRLELASEAARLVVLEVVRGKPKMTFAQPNASVTHAGRGQ